MPDTFESSRTTKTSSIKTHVTKKIYSGLGDCAED